MIINAIASMLPNSPDMARSTVWFPPGVSQLQVNIVYPGANLRVEATLIEDQFYKGDHLMISPDGASQSVQISYRDIISYTPGPVHNAEWRFIPGSGLTLKTERKHREQVNRTCADLLAAICARAAWHGAR